MAVIADPDPVWPLFLGGSLRPIGCVIAFLDGPLDQVVEGVLDVHEGRADVIRSEPLSSCLRRLDPMEAPWTREVLIGCDGWTAYLNNGLQGGDITAVAPPVARKRGWRCVSAQHMPRHGPGHAASQLWLQGPDGVPPLMQVRTLSVHSEDGRWTWHAWGDEQPFERTNRYSARRKRDRLDRGLLVEYLDALEIRVDEPAFFGEVLAVVQDVDRPVRSESAQEFRAANNW